MQKAEEMIYRNLGHTDLQISLLGFGAMRLPVSKGATVHPEAINLIHHAISRGITFFDVGTFYCHHECEKIFGLATLLLPEKAILFCGKNASHQQSGGDWPGQLQNTLALFGRKQLDLYFLHYLDRATWQRHYLDGGVLQQVEEARRQGLFRHLGFSSHDSPANVQALIDTGLFEAVILPFNLLQQEYRGVMQYAHQCGLGVIAMNPLAGGVLAREDLFKDSAREDLFRELTRADLLKDSAPEYLFKDSAREDPCKDSAVPTAAPAALALNYLFSQPFIDCVLSGMETKEVIDENVALIAAGRFDHPLAGEIEQLIDQRRRRSWIPCTACGYCMPCPQGIDIPGLIAVYNQFSAVATEKITVRDYFSRSVTAESCVQCGSCEEKCPQKISIAQLMQTTSARFDAF